MMEVSSLWLCFGCSKRDIVCVFNERKLVCCIDINRGRHWQLCPWLQSWSYIIFYFYVWCLCCVIINHPRLHVPSTSTSFSFWVFSIFVFRFYYSLPWWITSCKKGVVNCCEILIVKSRKIMCSFCSICFHKKV